MKKPSLDLWLAEAKAHPDAHKVGMYLTHNDVVRSTARVQARYGQEADPVRGMVFRWNRQAVSEAVSAAEKLEGIHYVRVWLNEGDLAVGDDIIDCFDAIDTMSTSAQIYFNSRWAGYEPVGMTDEELEALVPAFNLPRM